MAHLQSIAVPNPQAAPAAARRQRDTSLDALRGLAACQVLLLHYFSAFFPGLAFATMADHGLSVWVARSPLGALWDGYTAVCIFFILSGYVLTRSFAQRSSIPAHILSRWVRLVVPALASCIFAAIMLGIFGHANLPASDLLHSASLRRSEWIGDLMHVRGGIWFFLRDSLISSWLAGYVPNGPGASIGFHVHTLSIAYNAVLWTLSIEFFGSLIVLFLSRLRGQLWWAASLLLGLFFFRSFYWLFVAGHILAVTGRNWKNNLPLSACILLLAGGLWLSHTMNTSMENGFVSLNSAVPDWFFPWTRNSPNKPWGALLIFIAIIGSRSFSSFLASPRLRLLGELSFAIYLVHLPILLTLSSKVLLTANPVIGLTQARCLTLAVGIPATFIAAYLFRHVDRLSIVWSRAIRGSSNS